MFKSTFISLCCILFFVSCQPQVHLVKSDNHYQEIKTIEGEDTSIVSLIAPYKKDMEKEMNTVIGEMAKMLTKAQPESTLGNWATDLVHQKCEDYLDRKIDFAVLNYGGLRITSIPKGPVTKGKIFELMPFDNLLVVIEMKGSELPALFNHIAANGGWPLSKQIEMTAHRNKAVDVRINGRKVENDRIYSFATNDYIANGGDKCTFLKDKKQIPTGVLFRDAILQYVQEQTKAGKKLDANLSKRIFVLK
ncbi:MULTISPECIES: 5'-nucleotidase C-terminal domain-containing protein [unclassified Aureispira]|uniref:5'-nucleotidase C-terminal domain-containing protein n=1 Tax=unclassified Aureispira TaxID=2649989 RepID=UPI000695F4A8|nr:MULTISPECIES: 5'-nucleotidase C-terminal domain-containing protein [unclassified Aureispira]WMX16670.1 5'-nucleotidase C-terminal domain-containing protein [Aureispira sp. CCB-E]